MLLRPYDARFKLHQKLEGSVLNERAAKAHRCFQDLESKPLLWDLLGTTEDGATGIDCHEHMVRLTASTSSGLSYGHRVRSTSDSMLVAALDVNREFNQLVQVGRYLVDSFPVLNNLPGFLAPWKAEASDHWQRQCTLHLGNLQRGLDADGWNFSKHFQRAIDSQGIDMAPEELALDIGIMADAALEATTETMMWFVVACIAEDNNGWVATAQKQLDTVVERDRLPRLSDIALYRRHCRRSAPAEAGWPCWNAALYQGRERVRRTQYSGKFGGHTQFLVNYP